MAVDITRAHFFFLVMLYGICSISLTVFNKDLALRFPYPWTTILLQHIGGLMISGVAHVFSPMRVERFRRHHLVPAIGNGMILTSMLFCSLNALRYSSVALYVVARNAVPVVVACIEVFGLGSKLAAHRLVGLCFVVVGAIGFSLKDTTLEFRGYSFVAANVLIVGGASIYDKLMVTRFITDQSPVGINLYRVAVSCPLVLLMAALTEWPLELSAFSSQTVAALACTSVFAFGIGSLMFELNKTAAATTIQVTNMFFKFVTILVSLIFWPQSIPLAGWAFVSLSLGGVGLYSIKTMPKVLLKNK